MSQPPPAQSVRVTNKLPPAVDTLKVVPLMPPPIQLLWLTSGGQSQNGLQGTTFGPRAGLGLLPTAIVAVLVGCP